LDDIEQTISILAGSLEASSMTADVVALRELLSKVRNEGQEAVQQLKTTMFYWNELQQYDEWNNAKMVELKANEHMYFDKISSYLSDLQVILRKNFLIYTSVLCNF
jgi:hypothetical protein